MLVPTFRTREGGRIHVGLAIAWDLTLCSPLPNRGSTPARPAWEVDPESVC